MPISPVDSTESLEANLRRLVVFTKPARPGRVKTRLIGDLSASQTAQLHAAFVDDVVERLSLGRFSLRLAWALDDGDAVPSYELPDGREILGARQVGDSLGDRLFRGLADAAQECPLVAAMGSDHPTVPLAVVEEAFERLRRGADVVLGPATDGGYYLIACSRQGLREGLFQEIPWSTSEVLEKTLSAARRLGLRSEKLAEGADVDTPDDLALLVADLRDKDQDLPPCDRTRAVLRSWGLLSPGGTLSPEETPSSKETLSPEETL